jgi:hypothetical protein
LLFDENKGHAIVQRELLQRTHSRRCNLIFLITGNNIFTGYMMIKIATVLECLIRTV